MAIIVISAFLNGKYCWPISKTSCRLTVQIWKPGLMKCYGKERENSMAQWLGTLSTIRKEISYKYSLLFFGYNCFTKAQVLANPHGSIPNSHKREAEEKAESAADLGDHCRLLVKKFLSLHRGVPCLSEKREDEVVWRIWELERGGDGPPLELVLQVVARLSAAGLTPDYLQLFVLQLKVDPLKLPAKEAEYKFWF